MSQLRLGSLTPVTDYLSTIAASQARDDSKIEDQPDVSDKAGNRKAVEEEREDQFVVQIIEFVRNDISLTPGSLTFSIQDLLEPTQLIIELRLAN